ncbi:hypothetical protein BO71DRAFT_437975 [Aspergillus ellipticus CBS 707.79]|uniref:Uncharacterized protein n=1 Tax=Aspergillus ellipticus CBS 707.79 TaxID=1448320 RepID=A0A319DME7_9EURO|nr:hypothetical protein BO71DRAFT_437975 [Aspergillus ellipticus CBS 707.79]
MSDDEDYYDEYDEDIFWVEEPDPTIADDLAATATITNDAIFYDDPALEAEEFFSDWDDLSDDYYDEDPTAVRRQRALGLLPQPATKAKRSTVTVSTVAAVPKFDVAAFQGTVWKSPSDEVKIALHEPGEGEKVALLKNWREVFRNSHPAIGRIRVRVGGGSGRREDGEGDVDVDVEEEGGKEREEEVDGEYDSGVGGVEVEDAAVKVEGNGLEVEEKDEEVNGVEVHAAEPIQAQTSTKSKPSGVEKPAATRGRKRKADAEEPAPEPPTRSKRVATQKVGETKEPQPAASGPVRRSTRNKK